MDDGNGSAHLVFFTAATGPSSTTSERMRISNNGNVIISNALLNIHGGIPFAVPNNYMAKGSLTIGSTGTNYGGGNNWNANTAAFLMECQDNTEIAIHDSGDRLASFMHYISGTSGYFKYGRDMGSGPTNHQFYCNSWVGIMNDVAADDSDTNLLLDLAIRNRYSGEGAAALDTTSNALKLRFGTINQA
eukprot:496606-Hanusia_phi.AAC.1